MRSGTALTFIAWRFAAEFDGCGVEGEIELEWCTVRKPSPSTKVDESCSLAIVIFQPSPKLCLTANAAGFWQLIDPARDSDQEKLQVRRHGKQ